MHLTIVDLLLVAGVVLADPLALVAPCFPAPFALLLRFPFARAFLRGLLRGLLGATSGYILG